MIRSPTGQYQIVYFVFVSQEHIVHFLISEDETVDVMKFQHYANQFIPLIVPYGILTLLNKNQTSSSFLEQEDENGMLLENYTFLRQLFFDDFIYEKGTESEVKIR